MIRVFFFFFFKLLRRFYLEGEEALCLEESGERDKRKGFFLPQYLKLLPPSLPPSLHLSFPADTEMDCTGGWDVAGGLRSCSLTQERTVPAE